MRVLRRAAAMAALLMGAVGIQVIQGGAVQAALPTAAVALGDSFISGEGAGDYQPVVDVNGVGQAFPGWSAANNNAYFCHRSANASLYKANLPGIQDRFNLACSGGQPADIANRLRRPGQGPHGRLAARPAARRRADPRHRPGADRPRFQQQLVHLRRRGREVRQPLHRRRLDRLVGVLGLPGRPGASRSPAPPPTWPPPRRSPPRPPRPPPPYARSSTTLDQIDADGAAPGRLPGLHQPAAARPRPAVPGGGQPATTPATSSATSAPSGTRPAARSTGPASPPATCFSQGLGTMVKHDPHHPGRRVPRRPTWSTSTSSRPSTAPGSARPPAARRARSPRRSGCRTAPTGTFVTSLVRQGQDRHPADREHLRHLLPDLPGVVAPERRRARRPRPVPDRRRVTAAPARSSRAAPRERHDLHLLTVSP